MPPYWDNKALPTPTLTLPDTFIFNFLIISFIFIENKCLSDAIRKSSAKGGFEKVYALPATPLKLMLTMHLFLVLTNPITR